MQILVAEDDPTTMLLVSKLLAAAGHDVLQAWNGDDALAFMRAGNAPNLAVLDRMMPGIDGDEVCRRIRENEKNRSVHSPAYLIMHSANDRSAIAASLDAGANDYVVKPLHREEFLARIRVGERVIALQSEIEERLAESARLLEKVSESNERFQLATDGVRDGIWDWNLRTNELYLSPKWKEMIGYRDDEIPNEFSTFESRLHPGDKPRVMSYVSNYLKGGIPVYSIESRLLHRDGTYRWILARGEALCDENGVPYRMAGSHTDVTERVESEMRQIENSEFLGTLLDNLNAGVMIVDPKTRIIEEVNPKVEELIGLSKDQIVGRVCHRFLCPTERHSCPILDLNQSMDNRERVMIDSTGREIPILKTVKKVLFGGRVKLLETFVDISDLKRTEDLLRTSERRWNFALEGAGDGVWDWNAKTGKVFFSRKWKEMLGYDEEEIGDSLDEWMTRVHPDDLDLCMREIDRHFRGEVESYECEHRVRRKNGTYAWILDRSKIVERDPSGKPERVIGTHTDITKRVESENERVLTEARLAQAEKLSMLGSLVAGVGHEINNPAAIIMMNAPVLREILDELLPVFSGLCAKNGIASVGKRTLPQTKERLGLLLDGIETGVGRIRDVVKGLRDFSESESSMGQSVSVVHAAQCAESFLRKPMRDCDAVFSVSYEEGIPEVSGCLHRITQAITSCLENASESIRGPKKTITLSVRHVRERNVVAVEIRDEGCGIPPEDVSKATEPFFTTKRHDGGVGRGIGLTIVERIMRDHGGSVRIASEPGIGTTVFLEFPVADPNR